MNTLIAAGTPIRAVARMFGVPRSSLARHASHIQPLPRRLGVVPAPPIDLAPVDPLEEALQLAERARTERERLKALEQIRAATTLKIRGQRGDPGAEATEMLDRNVQQAEEAYRLGSGGFEATVRALQGLREALRQRLDAVKPPEPEAPIINLEFFAADADPPEPPAQDPSTIPGVPEQFRDPAKYQARHRITLHFDGDRADEDIRIYETKTGALAWRKER